MKNLARAKFWILIFAFATSFSAAAYEKAQRNFEQQGGTYYQYTPGHTAVVLIYTEWESSLVTGTSIAYARDRAKKEFCGYGAPACEFLVECDKGGWAARATGNKSSGHGFCNRRSL